MPLSGTLRIAADHPAFAGHFPGPPLLPGVVLLDLILAEAGIAALRGITRAKFLRPVGPGARVSYTLENTAPDRLALSVHGAEGVVLRATLRLARSEEG